MRTLAAATLSVAVLSVLVACSSSGDPTPNAADAATPTDAASSMDAATDAPTEAATDAAPASGTGCGGRTYTGSCHGELATPNSTSTCNDFYDWDVNSAKATCPANVGAFSTTPCTTTGNVGSCEKIIASKICALYWYFSPYGTSEVQQGCPAPATFHAP